MSPTDEQDVLLAKSLAAQLARIYRIRNPDDILTPCWYAAVESREKKLVGSAVINCARFRYVDYLRKEVYRERRLKWQQFDQDENGGEFWEEANILDHRTKDHEADVAATWREYAPLRAGMKMKSRLYLYLVSLGGMSFKEVDELFGNKADVVTSVVYQMRKRIAGGG